MRKLFKGGNYSREETINYWEVLTAETIQRRKLFKGGNYMRKYGNQKTVGFLSRKLKNDAIIMITITLIRFILRGS